MSGPYAMDNGEVIWAEVIPTSSRKPWRHRWVYEVHSQRGQAVVDMESAPEGSAFTLRKTIRRATAAAYQFAYEAENE